MVTRFKWIRTGSQWSTTIWHQSRVTADSGGSVKRGWWEQLRLVIFIMSTLIWTWKRSRCAGADGRGWKPTLAARYTVNKRSLSCNAVCTRSWYHKLCRNPSSYNEGPATSTSYGGNGPNDSGVGCHAFGAGFGEPVIIGPTTAQTSDQSLENLVAAEEWTQLLLLLSRDVQTPGLSLSGWRLGVYMGTYTSIP